jgi:hypothetical protein
MNANIGLGLLIVACCAAAQSTAQDTAQDGSWTSRIGMQIKMSTLGAGIEGAFNVAPRINVRAGFNDFSYGRSFDNSGIHYDGSLTLRSASVNADFYVLGPLHLSPGLLLYDGNRGSATASVSGGQTFTLGSTTYLSNPSNPANGSATLGFNAAAPEFLIGLGNLVPRSRFTVNFEFGAAYQGAPTVKLNLGGGVCNPSGGGCLNAATDPTVQSNVETQQAKLSRNLSFFRFYPLVSLGFGYHF